MKLISEFGRCDLLPPSDKELAKEERKDFAQLCKKIAAISKEVGGIKKGGKNEHDRYEYITNDQIVTRIREGLESHGLFILTRMAGGRQFEIGTSTGKVVYKSQVFFDFKVVDTDTGYTLTESWCGEDQDRAKSFAQAQTDCQKRFYSKLFNISTPDEIDPDQKTNEVDANTNQAPPKPRYISDLGALFKSCKREGKQKVLEAGKAKFGDDLATWAMDEIDKFKAWLLDYQPVDAEQQKPQLHVVKKAEVDNQPADPEPTQPVDPEPEQPTEPENPDQDQPTNEPPAPDEIRSQIRKDHGIPAPTMAKVERQFEEIHGSADTWTDEIWILFQQGCIDARQELEAKKAKERETELAEILNHAPNPKEASALFVDWEKEHGPFQQWKPALMAGFQGHVNKMKKDTTPADVYPGKTNYVGD